MNKKKIIRLVLFILGISIFLLMFGLLITNNISKFDDFIYKGIASLRNDFVTIIGKMISFLSSTYFIIGFILITLIFYKDKKIAFYICLNIILCVLFNQGLKFLIRRDRPIDINIIIEKGFSFPSGHSMVSFAFYGFFIYLFNKDKIKGYRIYTILFSVLIFLIGLSRIYLGVHYASDVLAGFSLSLSYLVAYIMFYEKRITKS